MSAVDRRNASSPCRSCAWGVAPWREYATILHETYTRDHVPRFARLGIELVVA